MASPAAKETDPSSLLCVACGCHRNFHRRYNPSEFLFTTPTPSPENHAPPPPSSPPPTYVASPVPRSFYASGPHMLYNFSSGGVLRRPPDFNMNDEVKIQAVAVRSENSGLRTGQVKRSRTKFTEEQKEKMRVFAEESDWMIRSCDETTLDDFCRKSGISRNVLKVWFHNNKYKFRGHRISDLNGGSDNVGAHVSGDGSSAS
ncbi:PREDICTED: zinc-finger homeodomain protein 11 [Tarenaya hassleriana]|uniref:zinc-finger homeodomain protein 11 n=1 Tax=Tarenaya hassleriana TaxID=28532 RepID=UPI00053C91C3|nr:PREDICTED: zinc-finger homeodomain protein 11 [Tarenaya hassleriana]